MTKRGWARGFPPLLALILVLSACGPATAPTATPAGAVPTVAATQPAQPSSATPTPSSAISAELLKNSPYRPEKLSQLLTENFYVHGMMYGQGQEPQYGGIATFTHRMDIPSSDPMVTATISLAGLTKQLTGVGNLVRPQAAKQLGTRRLPRPVLGSEQRCHRMDIQTAPGHQVA